MTNVRNNQYDNIKALLIFLVVLGHVLSKFGHTVETVTLYKIIFSFHMPAFLFVSGYFAKYDSKRVLAKLFPLYIVFQCLQLIEMYLIGQATGHPKAIHIQFFKPEWTLWYLMALMVFQLMLPLFETDSIRQQIRNLIIALILGLAIGLTPNINNFMAMSRVFVFLFFYLLGYYEKKNQILNTFLRKNHPVASKVVFAAVGITIIVLLCVFGKYLPARTLFGTESYSAKYTVQGRVLAWIMAFSWIMVLLSWIPDKKLKFIGVIGKNTLSIYLLHSLVLLILVKTPVNGLVYNSMTGILVLSVILTIILSWKGFEKLLRKIRIPI